MRIIDGTRYISAKEYAEMAGITAGRVSQLKNELPFVKFEEFGFEAINFDLLDLQQQEKALAIAKFEVRADFLQISYKDLGLYISKFAHDQVNFRGSAEVRLQELNNDKTELATLLAEEKLAKQLSLDRESELKNVLEKANTTINTLNAVNAEAIETICTIEENNTQLGISLATTSKELAEQKIVNESQEKLLAQKAVEADKHLAEIEHLKFKVATLEAETSLKDQLAALFATLNTKNSEKQ